MPRAAVIAIDLVSILVLTLVLYFPRHRRADMVVAYLGLNVGVLTVAVALSLNTSIGTGFGLGLFGALSIIRLRSSELSQQEVADVVGKDRSTVANALRLRQLFHRHRHMQRAVPSG